MKYSNAQVAKHLGVTVDSLMHVVERGDQIVVILNDYRKMVFPAAVLAGGASQQAAVGDVKTADGPGLKKS